MNVVLYRTAKDFYTREARFRLAPSGMPSLHESGPASSPRVLLLGDSRCAQWRENSSNAFRMINGGVGNETTAQVMLRAEHTISAVKPEIVVIQVGTNDLKVIPLLHQKKREIIDGCVSNIRRLTETSRASGSSVILLSVLPAGKVDITRRLVWSDDVALAVSEVNQQLSHEFRAYKKSFVRRSATLDRHGEALSRHASLHG